MNPWTNPTVWMYLTLVAGIVLAGIATIHIPGLEKVVVSWIAKISLTLTIVLAGVFKTDGYTRTLTIIVGLVVVWFGGAFLRYLGQSDQPEASQAQPHA